ncbi:glycosyl transferase family 2 [Slackia equolifaciens]|uniref:Glycosyl transferase family 2 n=1 Tax=Slackia equolifaciens TaxID=498718 RepID=A0A3N0ATP2_9ACTN|nr:glycosyltransferase [Slackia equolifaciens]RNL38205.1 glycosyl transferase family 2 [Slackia equolifaciens]
MQPLVSIFCTAYNQAPYIEKTLQGFVSQNTTFPFEVIVHDDASSDGTQDIIGRYSLKYPEIIKPVLQEENQYSKGISLLNSILLPRATGKYIAMCEGDDFWVDDNKLQRQFDFLEQHRDYSLVLHNAYIYDYRYDIVYLSEPMESDCDKTLGDIAIEGGGLLNPTASMFFRRQLFDHALAGPVGDHFIMLELASKGKVRWFSDPMSVYRFHASNSWSVSKKAESGESIRKYTQRYIDALRAADDYSGRDYHDAFVRRIKMQREFERKDLLKCGAPNLDIEGWGFSVESVAMSIRRHMPQGVEKALGRAACIKKKKRESLFVGTMREFCG